MMKKAIIVILVFILSTGASYAQANLPGSATGSPTKEEQEILDLSKAKWLWMSDKDTAALNGLFHDKSVFVHMSGSWGKSQEINVIESGRIGYKHAAVYSANVNLIGNTAILLNDIDLLAIVGGNEVMNPFMVTEVYIKEEGKWKMASLTFSKLRREVKMSSPIKKDQEQ